MDLSQFDPTSIGSEIGQFVVEMNVKREHDEDLERYSSAAKLYAKQVEPNIMIDITGNDPIVIKTDPDQSNLIANRRVAYENVAHKTDESLKKPMKPLVHRCVGRIFAPSHRRRDQLKDQLHQQARALVRQLDGCGDETDEAHQCADERDAESIRSPDMGPDWKNEPQSFIIANEQAEIPTLNELVVVEPDLPPTVQLPTVTLYCSYCNRSFRSKRGLSRHINETKMHAENVHKAQAEQIKAAANILNNEYDY